MAVAIDAISLSTGASNVASFSWTHTPVGTPSAVAVIFPGYAGNAGTRTVTATYGGTNVPVEVATAGNPFATGRTPTIFGLANLAALGLTGAQTVVVACAGAGMYGRPWAITVTGSDLTDVFSNSNNATNAGSSTASVTVTTANDEIVIDAVSTANSNAITVGANQTERVNYQPSITITATRAGGSTQLGSDGGVMSWGLNTSAAWDIVAASFKAAAGGNPWYYYATQNAAAERRALKRWFFGIDPFPVAA